jgi:hypothetical protein
MRKISINSLVELWRQDDEGKVRFKKNLQKPKPISKGGGDYWISCKSAVNEAFVKNDISIISKKIEELEDRIKATPYLITKTMFQRNVEILNGFETNEFSRWCLDSEIHFLYKPAKLSTFEVSNIPILVRPSQVFTYVINNNKFIGAIWFVAKIGGYSHNELATFVDSMYRYLILHYSQDYEIDFKFCVVMDLTTKTEVSYKEISNGKFDSFLDRSLNYLGEAA